MIRITWVSARKAKKTNISLNVCVYVCADYTEDRIAGDGVWWESERIVHIFLWQ